VLIATPTGAQIPIGQVAKISFSNGPAMIRDEDGQLTGYVYIDLNTKDYGGFVKEATHLLRQKLKLPAATPIPGLANMSSRSERKSG